jgi:translocation and assembly module TamB
MVDVRFDASLPNVNPLVSQLNGAASAQGRLRQNEQGFFIDTTASGPYGARANVEGLATGPDMQLTFDASMPNVNPLAPGVSGPLAAKGVLRQTPTGIAVDTNATGPYASRGSVRGVVTGSDAAVEYTLALPNIGVLVDRVNGPLDLRGTAHKEGTAWRLNTNADGPSGTQATVGGLVKGDGTLALDINGSAPLLRRAICKGRHALI